MTKGDGQELNVQSIEVDLAAELLFYNSGNIKFATEEPLEAMMSSHEDRPGYHVIKRAIGM